MDSEQAAINEDGLVWTDARGTSRPRLGGVVTAPPPEPERWVSTEAGRHLSGRVSKHTVPELLLRRALHEQGARFRLHPRIARGCTPDLVLPRHRVAVFVDGDFFHGCPEHGRTKFSGPNAALWEQKLLRNRERDERSTQLAREAGWTVVRLWECQVKRDAVSCAQLVLSHSTLTRERHDSEQATCLVGPPSAPAS